ncbi:MAG: DNA-binding protein [Cyclobacteriaceae bacterium]
MKENERNYLELPTISYLRDMEERILSRINEMQNLKGNTPKKWVKGKELRELMGGMSNNTLVKLRNEGTIPFKKLGGVYYYNVEDIKKTLSTIK